MHQGRYSGAIDYDGMYVPGLQGRKSSEIGNVHFQLPGRTEVHFNPQLDRFSTIVIHLALRALSLNPALLERYETGGEGLDPARRFSQPLPIGAAARAGKPARPAGSRQPVPAKSAPAKSAWCRAWPILLPVSPWMCPAAKFRCRRRPKPPFSMPIFARACWPAPAGWSPWSARSSQIFRGTSKDGTPHVFLNMGYWRLKCFTIVLWDGALELYEASSKNPDEYQDQWLSVTGMLTVYERRPQILINSPTDIQVLAGEKEAQKLLGLTSFASDRPAPPAARPAPTSPSRQPAAAAPTGQPHPAGCQPAPRPAPARQHLCPARQRLAGPDPRSVGAH